MGKMSEGESIIWCNAYDAGVIMTALAMLKREAEDEPEFIAQIEDIIRRMRIKAR